MLGREFREKVGQTTFNPKTKRYEIINIEKFSRISQGLVVLAQASSEDKKLLIDGLSQVGLLVGYVGDGYNDISALKRADIGKGELLIFISFRNLKKYLYTFENKLYHPTIIGVAMGLSGTYMAKESAEAIISDDRLENLLIGVEWGRNIIENLQRLLFFHLTTYIVLAIMLLINETALPEKPFGVLQVMWLVILGKFLPGIILASEQPSVNVLKIKPIGNGGSKMANIHPDSWKLIIVQAFYQVLVYSIVLSGMPMPILSKNYKEFEVYHPSWETKIKQFNTNLFNYACFLIIFNLLNARKIQNSEKNSFQGDIYI